MQKKVAISWSGGKDCCLALHNAQDNGLKPSVLLCMMDSERDYSRSNGVSRQILEMQSVCLNLPIYFVKTTWEQYEDNLVNAISELKNRDSIDGCVFGDMDIESHKLFEKSICEKAGIVAYLPLWGTTREEIRNKLFTLGIKSKLSVINKSFPIAKFIGSDYHEIDSTELIELGVDICGENGEFHTVVYDAPLFSSSIKLEAHTIYDLGSILLCDFIFPNIYSKFDVSQDCNSSMILKNV